MSPMKHIFALITFHIILSYKDWHKQDITSVICFSTDFPKIFPCDEDILCLIQLNLLEISIFCLHSNTFSNHPSIVDRIEPVLSTPNRQRNSVTTWKIDKCHFARGGIYGILLKYITVTIPIRNWSNLEIILFHTFEIRKFGSGPDRDWNWYAIRNW